MNELISQAKKNRFSNIPDLTTNDVFDIWDNISRYIEQQMLLQKGVVVPGLGTFTFSQRKLDMGGNKYVLFQRPIFIISEKFAKHIGLIYTKTFSPGDIPIVNLNYSYLSSESPFDRDSIEACVKEVLIALSRAIQANRNIEFTFTGVGRLCIRNKKVKMKFFKDFINCMDGSGNLARAMINRPYTADSVISPTVRPSTGNTLTLPRLNNDNDKELFAPEASRLTPIPRRSVTSVGDDANSCKNMPIIREEDAEREINNNEHKNNDDDNLSYSYDRANSRISVLKAPTDGNAQENGQSLSPVTINATTIPGTFLNQSAEKAQSSVQNAVKYSPRPVSTPQNVRVSSKLSTHRTGKDISTPPPTPQLNTEAWRPVSRREENQQTNVGEKKKIAAGKVLRCAHHGEAGQELCYLCHQREKRNVQISYAKEKDTMDKSHDRVLQQYQQQKDAENIAKDLEREKAYRNYIKQLSEYNLSAAENKKKMLREMKSEAPKMILNRELTPSPTNKQREYHRSLDQQVQERQHKMARLKQEKNFLEKLEQAQLAEEIQREQQYKTLQRQKKLEDYANCLKSQITSKSDPLPIAYSNSSGPLFGTDTDKLDLVAQRRQRAHEIYKEQMALVEQAKRDKTLQKLSTERQEMESINKTKQELKEELVQRYVYSTDSRKQLEQYWQDQAKKKKIIDAEAARIPSPDEMLLSQCDKYHRCLQCQRKPENFGKSNFFKDTYFMSGTRFIT